MNHPTLTVSLPAIVDNWQSLRNRTRSTCTAAVVKANAYGLGVAEVSTALARAGCDDFFVATLEEALTLRAALPNVRIYVFQGVLRGEEGAYLKHNLRPILNTPQAIEQWLDIQSNHNHAPSPIVHIDSGMQRLGLNPSHLDDTALREKIRATNPTHIMTHYACASDLHHAMNAAQRRIMQRIEQLLPTFPTCYANSAGHFLPHDYHGDMTRPGCALYGINPCDDSPATLMRPVVTLCAPILQVRDIDEVSTIGYSATAPVRPAMRTLTVGIGYADGIHRTASHHLSASLGGIPIPMLGRVTMDMLCFDVTHVPQRILEQHDSVILMDERQTVDDVARIYGTIGYEVLTSLGNRIQRIYH
ncbi:MAG: alanine racemase [Alphaproteobacteria bacterium]|nr:MAG: alanine racemase [Alphaproteobacteria bacterium]